MVYTLQFPATLTDEELRLKNMFEKLKKWRKACQTLKSGRTDTEINLKIAAKRTAEEARGFTEHAKKLVKCGAMTITKTEEKQKFKRSSKLDKKLKEVDREVRPSGSVAMFGDFSDELVGPPKAKMPHLDETFVSSTMGDYGYDARRGKTIYIRGYDLTEEPIRKAFAHFGNITRLYVEEPRRKGAFVTFESNEEASRAIREMNGNMVGGITLRVSMARKQYIPPGNSQAWSQIASGDADRNFYHKDQRDVLKYDDEDVF